MVVLLQKSQKRYVLKVVVNTFFS
jgi:hypothetical protein